MTRGDPERCRRMLRLPKPAVPGAVFTRPPFLYVREGCIGGPGRVRYVGKIDREVYSCVAGDIVTDEVIITDERVQHIKERHPGGL